MPSRSLERWRTLRLPRLAELEAQVRAVLAAKPVKRVAAEEIARAYVLMLSGHFQGFCRELYSEAADALVTHLEKARKGLAAVLKFQAAAQLRLDHGNPTWDNIRTDYDRVGVNLRVQLGEVPELPALLRQLAEMNRIRNAIAHDDRKTADVIDLDEALVWRNTCAELAVLIDASTCRKLTKTLRKPPWNP